MAPVLSHERILIHVLQPPNVITVITVVYTISEVSKYYISKVGLNQDYVPSAAMLIFKLSANRYGYGLSN